MHPDVASLIATVSRNYRMCIKSCTDGGKLFVEQSPTLTPTYSAITKRQLSTADEYGGPLSRVGLHLAASCPLLTVIGRSFATVPGLALEQIYHFCHFRFRF